MRKEYLEIGKAVGTHGIQGEIRLEPWCDSPSDLLTVKTLFTDPDGKSNLSVSGARVHKRLVLLKLDGVDSIAQAEAFRGKVFFANRCDLPIPDGGHFIQDLLGAVVFHAENGEKLGELSDVSSTGANDVWHIKNGDKETLIPAVDEIVISVDADAGIIKIRPIKGLFDED